MQVILLEQVKKLGKIGEVVNVKGGYARNHLIPSQKALRATKDNIAYFDATKKDIEKSNAEKLAAAEKLAKKIDSSVVTLVKQAGEDGRLYGSVNAAEIAAATAEASGESIDRHSVVLHNPIKYIGIHDVVVELHAEASATIHVNIARTADEAKDAEKRHARGEVVMEGPGLTAAAEEPEEAEVVAAPETAEVSEEASSEEADAPEAEVAAEA